MEHTHQYDEQGKQLCCTEEEKINNKADVLIKNSPSKSCSCSGDDQDQHTDDDSHDHASDGGSNIKLFLPALQRAAPDRLGRGAARRDGRAAHPL